jgi:hypothetical protein
MTWKEQQICCYLSADEVFVLIRGGICSSSSVGALLLMIGIGRTETEVNCDMTSRSCCCRQSFLIKAYYDP